jgi:hypothetical protein
MATSAQRLEIIKCGRDPLHFMKTYGKIRTVQHGVVPFKTWPFQDNCVEAFLIHRLNILLKSRQLGLSTLTALYALWMAIFQKDRSILVIATKLSTAINFIKKVKVALRNLPPWLLLPTVLTESKSQLTFSNGSEITAITTSDDAGRSEALSLLIVDEAAFIKGFEEIWTGLYPTISTGGRAIVLSTPNGVGGQYYKLWVDAVAGLNDFNAINLPWTVRPDHDEAWFKKETRGFGRRKIAQEYLCDFLTSGDTFLQADDLVWLQAQITQPISKEGFDRNVWVWAQPQHDRRYVLTADVARGDGNERGDYSTFHLVDPVECSVAVEYKGKVPPDKLADMLDEWGRRYNNALIAPENNTFGHATCTRLRDHFRYPQLFYMGAHGNVFEYTPRADELPGFSTQAGTRTQILTKLEEMIRNRSLKVKSQRFYDEMQAFVWAGAKAQASKDSHDDLILSLAIAAWLIDTTFGYSVNASAVGLALLHAVSMVKRDISALPSTTVQPLVNPRIAVTLQHSVYRGVRTGPSPGSRFDFSWLR